MPFPTMPGEMTGEWLTKTLLDADVIKSGWIDSFGAKSIGGVKGAMGQLVRVNLTYEPADILAPHTLIAKFSPTDAEWRMNFHHAGFFESEIRFYRELAEQVTLSTPHCYYSALTEETGEFVLLLEDLAPARNGDRIVGCSLTEAELAIREVARFHAAWWGKTTIDPKLLGALARRQQYIPDYTTPLSTELETFHIQARVQSAENNFGNRPTT